MHQINSSSIDAPQRPSLRDWVAVGFRHSRLIAFTFLAVFAAVVLVTWLMPREFEAELKILVKPERSDPMLTADQPTQTVNPPDFTEQDLNSEVEILKSRDLLEKVAVESGLVSGDRVGMFYATRDLQKKLNVEPLKKTKLIKVTYRSNSRYQAAKVLQTLTDLYLQKHLDVHRPPGALDFFKARTQEYRKGLTAAEQRLAQFGNQNGVASAQLEKEITVHKLNDFESELRQTRAAITESEQRIRALESQKSATPQRLTTQVRTSDNALLLQQMKSTLLTLELKRTELLSKFAPDYRPVQEVEAQIAQTREALANAKTLREETTDRDTTHEWLTGELAKARAELSALQGRVTATSGIVDTYRKQVRRLNEMEIAQGDLIRSAKTAEQNYLLYSTKQEEARISDALDRQRIVNVAIAEPAEVPAVPVGPSWPLILVLGGLLAGLVSVGFALAMDYMDRSFRTPDEVEGFLRVPVLASLPLIEKPTPAPAIPIPDSDFRGLTAGEVHPEQAISEVT